MAWDDEQKYGDEITAPDWNNMVADQKKRLSKESDTLDDVPDGATYVKSTNDYTDAEKAKLAGIIGIIPKTVRFDGQLTTNMPQQFSTLEVDATLVAVRAVLRGSLPTGSSIKVQVTKNGSAPADSVLASDLPIEITTSETAEANGVYVVEGTLDSGMTTCSKYDWFQATITQVGSDYAGNDLDVQLVFE